VGVRPVYGRGDGLEHEGGPLVGQQRHSRRERLAYFATPYDVDGKKISWAQES